MPTSGNDASPYCQLPPSSASHIAIGLAAERTDRHPAPDDFAVSRHVGHDAPERLASARMDAKAGDQLVKDQRRFRLLGDAPHFAEKFDRHEIRPAALHRLDQHGGEFVGVRFENFQRLGRAVLEHQNFVDDVLRNARRDGDRLRFSIDHAAAHEHLVVDAVIGARHGGDLDAARHRPRQPHCREHRFRAGVAERRALHAGQLAHEFGDFSDQRRLGTDFHALAQLPLLGAHREVGRVPEKVGAETERDVEVLVVVEVPQARGGGMLHHDGIDDFLPRLAKSRETVRGSARRAHCFWV